MNNCSLKAVTLMFLLLPFLLSSFAQKKNSLLLIQKTNSWDTKKIAFINSSHVDVSYVA